MDNIYLYFKIVLSKKNNNCQVHDWYTIQGILPETLKYINFLGHDKKKGMANIIPCNFCADRTNLQNVIHRHIKYIYIGTVIYLNLKIAFKLKKLYFVRDI